LRGNVSSLILGGLGNLLLNDGSVCGNWLVGDTFQSLVGLLDDAGGVGGSRSNKGKKACQQDKNDVELEH